MRQENSGEVPAVDKPILDKEKSFEFEQGELKGEWQVMEKNGMTVEGAFFKSPQPNGEVIIFIPGAPGDAVSWFEEKDVPLLLENGYDVFVSRHGGVIPQKGNEAVFHNKQRFEKNTALGNNEMSIENWVKEPEILMEFFSGRLTTIISHSFGGLAVSNSIIKMENQYGDSEQNPIHNLKKWINLSGVNYDGETYRKKYQKSWQWYFENILSKSCNIHDVGKELASLEAVIDESSRGLPQIQSVKKIRMISINPTEDELVGEDAGLQLQKDIGHGLVVRDQTIAKKDVGDRYIHDYPHFEPDTLLRLIKAKTSGTKHVATLGRKNNKSPFAKDKKT